MSRNKKPPSLLRRILRTFVASLVGSVLLCAVLWASVRTRENMGDQAARAVRQAVLDAAVQCYAVEGVYPPSLEYLEKNYGLQINRNSFIVTYEVFASNVAPTVDVLKK